MKIKFKVWDIDNSNADEMKGYRCFTDTDNRFIWGFELIAFEMIRLTVINFNYNPLAYCIYAVNKLVDGIKDNALKGIKSGYIEL